MPAHLLNPSRHRQHTVAVGALTALLLAGCGSDDGGELSAAAPAPVTSAGQPSDAGTGAQEPDEVVTVSVQDGKVTPAPSTVTVQAGDVVRIDATSHVVDTLHVHGIDVELPLDRGVPGTLTFTAEPAGSYEVETHENGLLLFKLDVTG